MPRSVPRTTFRPPRAPDIEDVPTDSAGYAAAIAAVCREAVAQDMMPPAFRIPDTGREYLLDGPGALALVWELAADDRSLAWHGVLRLAPELGATIRWLRILKAAERRMIEADGHLAALKAKLGPAQPVPEPEPAPVSCYQDQIDALARSSGGSSSSIGRDGNAHKMRPHLNRLPA